MLVSAIIICDCNNYFIVISAAPFDTFYTPRFVIPTTCEIQYKIFRTIKIQTFVAMIGSGTFRIDSASELSIWELACINHWGEQKPKLAIKAEVASQSWPRSQFYVYHTWFFLYQHWFKDMVRSLHFMHFGGIKLFIHVPLKLSNGLIITRNRTLWNVTYFILTQIANHMYPDNKVHGANMGPTWVLSARAGPHELAIRVVRSKWSEMGYGWNQTISNHHNKILQCAKNVLGFIINQRAVLEDYQ